MIGWVNNVKKIHNYPLSLIENMDETLLAFDMPSNYTIEETGFIISGESRFLSKLLKDVNVTGENFKWSLCNSNKKNTVMIILWFGLHES